MVGSKLIHHNIQPKDSLINNAAINVISIYSFVLISNYSFRTDCWEDESVFNNFLLLVMMNCFPEFVCAQIVFNPLLTKSCQKERKE